MALSFLELQRIHSNKLATPNKKYYGDNENVYIGTSNKRLKLLEEAKNIILGENNNVQKEIEKINAESKKLKQIEIDFGQELYNTYKIFVIYDPDIKLNSIVSSTIAYEAPTNKELDEIEMDDIICYSGVNQEGEFNLIVKSNSGSLRDKFKINYIL